MSLHAGLKRLCLEFSQHVHSTFSCTSETKQKSDDSLFHGVCANEACHSPFVALAQPL